jgi:amidophosphoribosyltransferase
MCGIVAIVARSPVNQDIFDALTVLQHRGQDAAGMTTTDGHRIYLRKSEGMVRDVFHTRHMRQLLGNVGIGHVRYPTAGCSSSAEAQPFYVNSPYGITLAHNGNLTNTHALQDDVYREDLRHINTESDSEVLLNVLAHELARDRALRLTPEGLFDAITRTMRRSKGGYAVVAMIPGFGVFAFRDPNGIRPLVFGSRPAEGGDDWMVASESVALDALGFTLERDVGPGEAVFLPADGGVLTHQCVPALAHRPCVFEFVYFARPDSILDGISVHKARLRMGERLAERIRLEWPDHDIDVVVPIPDTSRTAALELANVLGLTYREGFIKNRYIPRTFIMPGQQLRQRSVRQKLNAIPLEFAGKNVLLVDDSIVRGTTSRQIVQMAREAGARRVYFASAAPPVRFPNVYGIDMPTVEELVANGRSEEEVGAFIGADRIVYQALPDLVDACRKGNPAIEDFDTSCFTGEYATGDVTLDYLSALRERRSEFARERSRGAHNTLIDLSANSDPYA